MKRHVLGESPCDVGQFRRIKHFDNARLSEGGAGNFIISRQACRVALRRLCSFLAAAAHQNNNRFFCLLCQVQKLSSVHQRFEIAGNDLRILVVNEMFQDVVFVDVALIADGTHLADAHDAFLQGMQQETGGKHSALHNHADVAAAQNVRPDQRIDKRKNIPFVGINKAHAVRAPQPDARSGGIIQGKFLNSGAFCSGFIESA